MLTKEVIGLVHTWFGWNQKKVCLTVGLVSSLIVFLGLKKAANLASCETENISRDQISRIATPSRHSRDLVARDDEC